MSAKLKKHLSCKYGQAIQFFSAIRAVKTIYQLFRDLRNTWEDLKVKTLRAVMEISSPV